MQITFVEKPEANRIEANIGGNKTVAVIYPMDSEPVTYYNAGNLLEPRRTFQTVEEAKAHITELYR